MKFPRVLCTAYSVIFIINAVVAGAGYVGYANLIATGKVNNVMNMLVQEGKPIDTVGILATISAIVIVLTHIFVLFRPVADASQSLGEHLLGGSEVVRKFSRTLPSFIILAIALGVKSLSLMVLLVASVTVMIMCLQLPPILYARMLYLRGESLNKPISWTICGMISLMLFFAMGVGLYEAVSGLSKEQ